MILRFVATAPQRLENFLCGFHCCPRPLSRAIGSIHVDAPLTFLFVFTCVLVRTIDAVVYPAGAAAGAATSFSLEYLACPPFRQLGLITTPLRVWRRRPVAALARVAGDASKTVLCSLGHTSWQHLRENVVLLLLVAPACERVLGARRLLAVWTASAAAGSAAHIVSTRLMVRTLR